MIRVRIIFPARDVSDVPFRYLRIQISLSTSRVHTFFMTLFLYVFCTTSVLLRRLVCPWSSLFFLCCFAAYTLSSRPFCFTLFRMICDTTSVLHRRCVFTSLFFFPLVLFRPLHPPPPLLHRARATLLFCFVAEPIHRHGKRKPEVYGLLQTAGGP